MSDYLYESDGDDEDESMEMIPRKRLAAMPSPIPSPGTVIGARDLRRRTFPSAPSQATGDGRHQEEAERRLRARCCWGKRWCGRRGGGARGYGS